MTNTTADDSLTYLVRDILEYGHEVHTRNSDVLRTIHPEVFVFTQTPLVGIRRTAWKNALREWEWFMSGSSDIKDLHPSVRKWWEPWASDLGIVGLNYSWQFRKAHGVEQVLDPAQWEGYDQIEGLIDGLISQPNSRRHVITTWNASDMNSEMCPITNCHNTMTQFFVQDSRLFMSTYQRSVDVMLGLPHNWIQQWAFLMWVAHRTGLAVGELSWMGGDQHIYKGHLDMAKRVVGENMAFLSQPELVYNPSGDEFKASDFMLDGEYEPIIEESLEMVT